MLFFVIHLWAPVSTVLLMVSRLWINGFAAWQLEFIGHGSFYCPAAIVLEELHPVTVIFWRSFWWHSRDLCWFLTPETKKFSNCVGHVCSRQSKLPLSVLAAGQARQDVWTKLFVFSPHAVDGALEVSDWLQFQFSFLDFLGCLFKTVFRWCLHRLNWIVCAGPSTMDGSSLEKYQPFVGQNRYRNDLTHARTLRFCRNGWTPSQPTKMIEKKKSSLFPISVGFYQNLCFALKKKLKWQVTHAEIKEEIRIVEAITAALGQEIEMANKLPGGNVGVPHDLALWMMGSMMAFAVIFFLLKSVSHHVTFRLWLWLWTLWYASCRAEV